MYNPYRFNGGLVVHDGIARSNGLHIGRLSGIRIEGWTEDDGKKACFSIENRYDSLQRYTSLVQLMAML